MCAELYGASGKWYNFVTVPPLEGPAGVRIAANNPFLTSSGAFLINAKTKHPEVAFRLADALYENEVFMRQKYGEPEVYYTATDVGDLKGINGLPAAWKELIPWGQSQNSHWNQTAPILETNDFRLGKAVVIDPEQDLEPILYKESKNNYEPYKVSRDMIVPPLFFNDEQSQELADVKKTIYDYVEEMVARFVIGDLELNENEWTRYLDTLEGMNLKRFLEINQEAYDSKYGK